MGHWVLCFRFAACIGFGGKPVPLSCISFLGVRKSMGQAPRIYLPAAIYSFLFTAMILGLLKNLLVFCYEDIKMLISQWFQPILRAKKIRKAQLQRAQDVVFWWVRTQKKAAPACWARPLLGGFYAKLALPR